MEWDYRNHTKRSLSPNEFSRLILRIKKGDLSIVQITKQERHSPKPELENIGNCVVTIKSNTTGKCHQVMIKDNQLRILNSVQRGTPEIIRVDESKDSNNGSSNGG